MGLTACALDDRITAAGAPAAVTCAQRLTGTAREFDMVAKTQSGRDVPITVFAPGEAGTYPLIAFSHGAYASPTRYRAMLEPLAGAGFIILAPMHIDSEDYPRANGEPERPPHPITWSTRNADYALALEPGRDIHAALGKAGLSIHADRKIALGHSYGALIAQLPGGAVAIEPDGTRIARRNANVDAVIGWSPPGPMPGFVANESWSTLTTPSLTITGTADILPGFIDDWQAHRASYDHAPAGKRGLWVGEGVDHYFGGIFGREKPATPANRMLFQSALETSLHFMELHANRSAPCQLSPRIEGAIYTQDKQP